MAACLIPFTLNLVLELVLVSVTTLKQVNKTKTQRKETKLLEKLSLGRVWWEMQER